MKFFDKVLNSLGLIEYVEADENEEKIEELLKDEENLAEAKQSTVQAFEKETMPWLKRSEERRSSVTEISRPSSASKVVSLPVSNQQVKMMVVEPKVFDDAQAIADHVRAAKPVVVNFEKTSPDVMKRIIDFISGTVYALNGNIQLVGNNIMVCSPQNVDINVSKDFLASKDFEPWR